MEKIIEFLDTEMQKPEMYGWFHILFILLSVALGILLCHHFKNPEEKTVRKILFITSISVIILELYKQFNFSFTCEDDKIIFDYQWYAFPFQFCSTPMYVGLLASLIKNRTVHKSLCSYLATFAFFAGTAVMLYPNTVFVSTIGINIQTMVCHGSMISIGMFLLYSNYVPSEHKTILKAIPVFSSAVIVAIILNEVAHISGLLETETFDMFFISRHTTPSLPVFSLIQPHVPFLASLIIYIAGFSLAAYIILLLSIGIKKISKKAHKA